LARSWAFAFGADFFGLSRTSGFVTNSAAARKRITRSEGWAPTDSQCIARSESMVTRWGWSFSSIGL